MDSGAGIVVRERTEHETVNFKLEWTITNFSRCKASEDEMYCGGITMADLGLTDYDGRFRFSVTPCNKLGNPDKELKYVSAFVCLTDTSVESRMYTGEQNISAEFEIRLATGKQGNQTIVPEDNDEELNNGPNAFSHESPEWGNEKLISHRRLFYGTDSEKPLIKDDCITISTDITLFLKPNTICLPDTTGLSNLPQRHREFIQRHLNWFESENYRHSTDFVLRSMDGREFHISRFLLMAQSPVFAAMLTHETAEKQSARCDLTDVDGVCLEILSAYISGCDIGKINGSNAEKALIMADKYQLVDLRSICEQILAGNVNEGNAVHYLILARQRELAALKEAALRLVPRHMGAILSDAALAEMVTSDPEAMQMIMQHCSKRVRYVL